MLGPEAANRAVHAGQASRVRRRIRVRVRIMTRVRIRVRIRVRSGLVFRRCAMQVIVKGATCLVVRGSFKAGLVWDIMIHIKAWHGTS